jgi:STE24 endopeptidase
MRSVLMWAAVAMAAVLVNVAVVAVAQEAGKTEPPAVARASPQGPPTVTVTKEMRQHDAWRNALYFGGAVYGFLVLLAVLALGISRRLRDLARSITPHRFLSAMVFVALLTVVTTVLSLPLDVLSGYVVPHRFDLSDQSLGSWLWDQAKGLFLNILLAAPILALALEGIRRRRRWWLALWLGSIPITLFLVLIGPVVLDPVFNTFEPLKDEELKTEILNLASRAGIAGGRLWQVDKSKQTKEMNAYVNGLGPTKRIVLWDTIIAKLSRDQLLFVMAHEMGHYVRHHVWKLLGFLIGLLLVVFWLGQRLAEWATRRFGAAWGFDAPHDPAALPLLLLLVSVFLFFLSPVTAGFSRILEHEADVFALELTHLNDAGARAFVKLAEDSKVLPDPHPFIRFWRYTHPTLKERIQFCTTYRPWEQGLPNRVWQGVPAR